MSSAIALGIEYCGSHFHGWQKQPGKIRTVQTVLEKTLSKIADHEISIYCAGRTDTGVHGLAQVIHFETAAIRNLDAWVLGGNSMLPPDVKILWAEAVPQTFHARFSAIARTYQYIILNTPFNSALLHSFITWESYPLDAALMQQAGQYLIGEQDFSSFRSNECQAETPNRNIYNLQVKRQDDFVILTVKANAFLHHMVRNIVGALIEVGKGKQKPEWIQQVLTARNRQAASRTAAANGLYLVKVDYPEELLTKNYARYPIIVTNPH